MLRRSETVMRSAGGGLDGGVAVALALVRLVAADGAARRGARDGVADRMTGDPADNRALDAALRLGGPGETGQTQSQNGPGDPLAHGHLPNVTSWTSRYDASRHSVPPPLDLCEAAPREDPGAEGSGTGKLMVDVQQDLDGEQERDDREQQRQHGLAGGVEQR